MAKVDIIISTTGSTNSTGGIIDGGADNTSNMSSLPSAGTGSSKNLVARSVYANQLANAGINALKSTFNFAKSNYGNFTGDYIGQQKIDNVFSVANTFASLGGSIISGAIVGGIPGAVVGAVVGVANIGINAWQNDVQYKLSIQKTNYSASFNSQRIGVVLNNGGR